MIHMKSDFERCIEVVNHVVNFYRFLKLKIIQLC